MKIGGIGNSAGSTASTRVAGTRNAKAESPVPSGNDVRLSSASAQLASGGGDSVDSARVSEIRQAISEGRLQINSGAIADRLIDSARELINSQRKV